MGVKKISVSLDDEAYAAAVEQAETEGVSLSAWLSRAARHEALVVAGLRAVAQWESEHGALTPEELAWADGILRQTSDARRAS